MNQLKFNTFLVEYLNKHKGEGTHEQLVFRARLQYIKECKQIVIG